MNQSGFSRLIRTAGILMMLLLWAVPGCAQTAPKRITTDELNTMLGDRQAVVVDVRDVRDWENSDQKIKGAIRVDPRNLDVANLPMAKDALLVLY